MFILQSCSYIPDGDGYYRESQPSLFLSRLPGVTMADCHVHHRFFDRLALSADVLILFFFHGYDLFPLIEKRRKLGKITVLETNDYYPDLPPWSPIAHYWRDPEIHEEHRHFIAAADAVQTSTPQLARHWEGIARTCAVFPNQMSEVPPLSPFKAQSGLQLGFAGSQSHFADYAHACLALEPWLKERPDCTFSILSGDELYPLMSLPPERYRYHEPVPIAEYYKFLSTLDAGIAPLLPTEYNRCRSDVKFLEYAACGTVGVFASPGPYDETVRHGETGFLYRTNEELVSILDQLRSDPALRQRVRENAHRYVREERMAEQHVQKRLDFYRSLNPQTDTAFPEEYLAAAKIDGNYIRFELDTISSRLVSLDERGDLEQNLKLLSEISHSDPGWKNTFQAAGRVLNNARRPEEALKVLHHALEMDQGNPRTMCEIARAMFLLRQYDASREVFETALKDNPLFMPGWLYLMNVLRAAPQADGRRIAEEALKHFPSSFRLRLAAAEVLPDHAVWLEKALELCSKFSDEQRPAAASLYVRAFERTAGHLGDKELALFSQACKLFPHSAKLASLHAIALRKAGDLKASAAEFARACGLRRTVERYREEFGDDEMSHRLWYLAEYPRV